MLTGAFASACADYAAAGWTCIIPVPQEAKFPPPEGFTGAAGRDTSTEDLVSWAGSHASHSVALRLPDGVIGIDVDDYEKNGKSKHGASTLAQREQEWGPLPATWSSTARGSAGGPGPSRIMFFRVPPGRYATGAGPDIDVIQRHHRYTVVAPSVNPETGTAYQWYDPDGQPAERVPSPDDLAWLPESWTAMLTEGATTAGPAPASRDAGQLLLDILLMDRTMPCAETDNAGRTALAELAQAAPGSRHDLMTGHVYHLIQLGAEGHAGAGWILAEWLEARWDQLTAGEGRDDEFANMLLSAARKGATAQGTDRAGRDPCLAGRALGWESPVPAGSETAPADMLQAPVTWSPREAWGAHVFETKAQLDSVLARDVLARTYPGLRYAADAATWIVRGPLKWESRKGEQAKWAAEEMFWLMPHGDPDADKSSEEYAQAARRGRFGTNSGAGGIAAKMQAQVMAGHHPCSVEMTGLDADADIIWAGGIAWDLRASLDYPVIATRINPGTPHMHTAACVPEMKATPLWDAFTAAVWPDEKMRQWGLRVLSVAFTGYPDKSLPILLGPTDRGKTELVKLLMSVLGTYALKSADARLLNAADRSHASIVYALKGCRLAFIDEAPRTGHLAQERLKSLTGGAPLTGNRMGENPITFNPSHTMVLTANPDSEPVLTDAAVRRRVRLLACDGDPAEIRAARAAIGFLSHEAWKSEAPGVLARMMTEAAAWIADPLSAENDAAPAYVQEAAEQIALMQDTSGIWLTEATERYESGTRSHSLYEYFVGWCKNSAITQIPSETRWGRRLTELGYPPEKQRDGNYRLLRIRPAVSYQISRVTQPPSESSDQNSKGYPAESGGGFGGGFVEGLNPNPPQDNARSNHPQLSTVEGVEGWHAHYTHTRMHAGTRAHTQTGDIKPSTPSNPPQFPAQAAFAVSSTLHEPSTKPSTLVFDLETADADQLFTYEPHDEAGFVRLAGVMGLGAPVTGVTPRDLVALLDAAPEISGHNVLGFDLLALAHHYGADWDSLSAKARDTELIARQADPPRSRESGSSADRYGLTEVAGRLGLPGKTDDVKRLARRHGGWDKIPLDDPEYRSYLEGDLAASAAVIEAMRERYPADPYVDREHRLARLAGTMTLNGFRVDRELLDNRIAEGQGRKQDALQLLHDGWGLPLGKTVTRGRGEGKHEEFQVLDSPLGSDSGRAWLEGIWERYGVSDPPRTGKTGKLAIGGDDLKPVADRPGCPGDLKALISLMGIVTGTRTVYQTALDNLCEDGRVHPRVSFRQASGRWSVTNPGLTVFGKHGGRHHERDIFIPEPGHVLLSFDLSQVDMRAMAWLSGDHEYRKMFAPGRDAHAEIAAQVGLTRQQAKAVGHGWNYGLGPKRMISNGLEESAVYSFIRGMEERFPVLIRWREQIREQGKAGEILYNGFGRRMRCDPERAYTVAPALMGQGGARDIMCESLLRLPESAWPMLRVMVHDEIVLSVPKEIAGDVAVTVKAAMTWDLAEDLPVLCDISGGQSWGVASAK